jgi:mannose-6-phosphate isomerase-like protein (cupin superfamily)
MVGAMNPQGFVSDISPQRIAALPPQAGEARWWFGGLALIKLSSSQTEGRFSLVEALWPPNLEVPLHVHSREDELFHVLAGKISYRVGESRFEASSGYTVFAPRNVPHGFTVTSSEPARYLIVYSPAGFEEFVRETSEPAQTLNLPPAPSGPIDPALLEKISAMMAAKYGCQFLR